MKNNNDNEVNQDIQEEKKIKIINNYKGNKNEESKCNKISINNLHIINDIEEEKNSSENSNETINNDGHDSDNSDNYIHNDNSFDEYEEEEKIDNNINNNENNDLSQDNINNENNNLLEDNNQINEINNDEENNNIEININNINNDNNIINDNNEDQNDIDLTIYSNKPSIYYYNCAKDYYESEKYRKSLIYIMMYMKLVPNNPRAFSLKGKIYTKLKMYQESLNNFLKSLKLGDDENLENIYGCAKAYKELNQFDNALFYYKKALNFETNAKSYYLLGTCLYSMGKKEEALELYNKSISLDNNYFLAYYNKGICLSNLNLKEEAIIMYDKTISINNNFIDAYFQKGYCLYNIKKYEQALEVMDKVLELDPNYYQAYYEKGFCLLKMKRINEAIEEISKFLEKNNKFENAYFQRGYCYELIKNYSLAIKDYYKVIEINNQLNEVYYRLGICLLNKKKISDALKMFNRAIKLNRANYEAYYFKGMCLKYLNYYEKAIITFNFFLNCFKINKRLYNEIDNVKIINTYYNKGKCLMSLKRYTEAIGMLTNYLKIDNNCLDVYYQRAISYYKVGQYVDAINDLSFIINNKEKFNFKKEIKDKNDSIEIDNSFYYDRNEFDFNNELNDSIYYCEEEKNNENIEINDNIQDIYLLRANSFFNINEIDKALNDYNEFFKIINLSEIDLENYKNIKDLTSAFFKRGYCYFVKKEYLLSLKDYENTLKLDSSYTTAYFNMAICLSNLNRKKESIYYYEKILNECPNDIEAYLGICKSYREIGNYKKASEYVEKAFSIFKDGSPKIANLYYEKGMCLYNIKQYLEAMNFFEKAIEFNNANNNLFISDCYYHKGICSLKINQKENGFKDFEQALKYNNKNGEIYYYKAFFFMDSENYEEAIDTYFKAINLNKEIYTNKNDGYFNIAYCYLQLEKFEEAKKYLILSKKINEDKIKNYFINGVNACEEGNIGPQLYLLDFSKIYKEIRYKFIDINYYFGICNLELNNYEEALNNFNMCIKYDNKFGDGYYYKGIVYSKLKKYQNAIEQYKKAIECNNIPIYQKALKNEEIKLNKLFDKIEVAEINLDDCIITNLKEKKTPNNNNLNRMKILRLNKSLNFGGSNRKDNAYAKMSLKNRINIFKDNNHINKSISISKNSRQIDLSQSSRELIKNNLKDNISDFEKNERIREIIKNNVSNSKNKFQNRILKKFHKKHYNNSKSKEKKNISFINKIKKDY